MKRSFLLVLVASLSMFYSCSNSADGDGKQAHKTGKGNRIYGGTLKLNESDPFSDIIYPPKIADAYTIFLFTQIYEGLVKFDAKDLSIRPSLAEKWEKDSSGTIYTFHLRKNVKFHDDPCFPGGKGRTVKASDFKYTFELFCKKDPLNVNFGTTFKNIVVGANDYYYQSKEGKPAAVTEVEGFKVVDDYTFQIQLTEPRNSFLNILAYGCLGVLPKESVEKYSTLTKVGSGPFILSVFNTDQTSILIKNPDYYGVDSLGNKLPFLDSITVTHLPSKKAELDAFLAHKLDIILTLPAENVKQLTSSNITDFSGHPPKYILDRKPEMFAQYFELNVIRKPFNDKRVRQAFAYAIDKEKIVKEVLNDEAYGSGIHGLTPPSFKGYDITKIKGYEYDPVKAKKLLAEAGYPGGKGFPQLTLEVNNVAKYQQVAFNVCEQLQKNLGVNVTAEIVPLTKKLEHTTYGRFDMARSGWLADYPSPENFLSLFYGKTVPDSLSLPSSPNHTRYKNKEFDALYEKGKTAKTLEESYEYFLKAEQIAINDMPLIPMWYDESYRIMQSNIVNFYSNPMRYRDFRETYIAETKEENKPAKP